MRGLAFLCMTSLFLGATFPAEADSPAPRFRPAVLGSGPDSLVNQIDTQDLFKKGQKDGAIMFCCRVATTGDVVSYTTYLPVPGSDLLEAEVRKRLDKARLAPAIYEHKPVEVLFYGTVFFSVVDGKPKLHIFANQEAAELKASNDFIGPQPVIGADSKFTGLHYPRERMTVFVKGLARLALKVDAAGNLQDLQAVSEEPPLVGLAQAALTDFTGAKFIPAFRDGDPVESSILLPVRYEPE
jgi:Gram-negative bacterial TonB protein C-terminal